MMSSGRMKDHSRIPALAVCLMGALLTAGAAVASAATGEAGAAAAKAQTYAPIDLSGFSDGIHHATMGLEKVEYARYEPNRIEQIADNLLLYQTKDGGWEKNQDWLRILTPEEAAKLPAGKAGEGGSFDNRNTYTQATYLARVYNVTHQDRYQAACLRALDFMLREQRPSGGWRGADVEAVTFNDDVMIGVMTMLREVARGDEPFGFVDEARRAKAQAALDRGLECILKCQIRVDGKLTAWCQQHAHDDFRPVDARAFEKASITAHESVGIVRYLMGIDNPSPQVVEAVQSAVAWLDQVKIKGIRVDTVPAETIKFKYHISRNDRVVVADPKAPPIWTRYYEIKTFRPFFCNRDRKIVYTLAEVERERRTGYGWYGYWPEELLAVDYPVWQKKWAPGRNVLEKQVTRAQ